MITFGTCPSGLREFHLTYSVAQVNGDLPTTSATHDSSVTGLAPGTWWIRLVKTDAEWEGPPPVSGIIESAPASVDCDDTVINDLFGAAWPCDGASFGEFELNGISGACVDQVQLGTCWNPIYGPCPDPMASTIGFGFHHTYGVTAPHGYPAYDMDIYGQMMPFSSPP